MSQAKINPTITEANNQTNDWKNLMENIKYPNPELEKQRQEKLSKLLTEWETEDLQEQQETWNFLQQAVNEYKINI
ncbi:hypothetical protein [Crocosphaera sp. XPORK-15E]|uniref:hypothetical protein n=1 Tax=Crocosphaera sp. XPORK-15E TaxID=3110247 RepID=UPI002B1E93FD|nr:hypothetical protein [Crocosphaera sp. XPORK-15E]MEA5534856.1 hypothetical protein [Crocosphaera sp. XPORK-15E]